jgi:hypothetical protein
MKQSTSGCIADNLVAKCFTCHELEEVAMRNLIIPASFLGMLAGAVNVKAASKSYC